MMDILQDTLAPWGVEWFGVCRYGDCLPLLPGRGVSRIPARARSVILCLFPYHIGEFSPRNLARYAVLPDYHRVAGEILAALVQRLGAEFPGESFVPFVDSSPIREVAAAGLAGLGVIGLHGQLIHRDYGSRVFVGEVVTTLELPPSDPDTGHCLECGACVAACPTGALTGNAPLDRSLCRSAISQKKGTLLPWEEEQLCRGGLVWGCDLCVDACPLNRDKCTPIRAFYHRPAPLLTAENLDELLLTRPYGWRGRAVLARNYSILNRS